MRANSITHIDHYAPFDESKIQLCIIIIQVWSFESTRYKNQEKKQQKESNCRMRENMRFKKPKICSNTNFSHHFKVSLKKVTLQTYSLFHSLYCPSVTKITTLTWFHIDITKSKKFEHILKKTRSGLWIAKNRKWANNIPSYLFSANNSSPSYRFPAINYVTVL